MRKIYTFKVKFALLWTLFDWSIENVSKTKQSHQEFDG